MDKVPRIATSTTKAVIFSFLGDADYHLFQRDKYPTCIHTQRCAQGKTTSYRGRYLPLLSTTIYPIRRIYVGSWLGRTRTSNTNSESVCLILAVLHVSRLLYFASRIAYACCFVEWWAYVRWQEYLAWLLAQKADHDLVSPCNTGSFTESFGIS